MPHSLLPLFVLRQHLNPNPFLSHSTDKEEEESWPPKDPNQYVYPDEPSGKHEFKLPDSPWTYENGSINPSLKPNLRNRNGKDAKSKAVTVSNVPPYHSDYHEPGEDRHSDSPERSGESEDDESEDGEALGGGEGDGEGLPLQPPLPPRNMVRVRRGSEGYEVKPIDREEMLRRFVENRLEEPGRYHRYVPEPASESEEEEEDEDVPLVQKVEGWVAGGKESPS